MQVRNIPQLAARIANRGWIAAALLSAAPVLAAPQSAPQTAPQAAPSDPSGEAFEAGVRTVSTEARPCLNLRARPTYNARIIGCLDIGSEVTVTGAERGWSRVSTASDGVGWVGTRLLDPFDGSSAAAPPAPVPRVPAEPEPQGRAAEPAPATDARVDQLTRERDELLERLSASQARATSLESRLEALQAVQTDAVSSERTEAEVLELRTRLAAAEEALRDSEALLTAAQGERDGASQVQRTLSEQVMALTAERERLTAELTRSEARQLYLRSDLEETRAELMRLKGVPPRLVAAEPEPPESTPAPTPPVAAPPADADAAAMPEPAPVSTPAVYPTEAVVAVVEAWARAWSEQRVDDYLSFYSPDFTPAEGESREGWERARRERVAAPRSILVTLDRLSPTVSAERAIVIFEQTYTSDSFRDVVDKTLVLELLDGAWRILRERAEGS